jgi:hypothetical protein
VEAAFMAHDVPMCCQQIDPAEWQRCGGAELGSAEEWSYRVCGMASLRMILLALGQDAPSLTELVTAGAAIGAFSERGLLHASVAELAAGLGVRGQAEAVPAEDLPGRLDGAPLIASVTTAFPVDGRRGGHLVVLRGYELGQADPLILFRDPSDWGQEHDRVRLSRLAQSYAGRCITFQPVDTAAGGSPECRSAATG